jgi:hypothetical protein
MINLPNFDININKIIQSYFNAYLKHKFISYRFITRSTKRLSLNKIYTSKAEIKHTSSKSIITIYAYNREKKSLFKKFSNLPLV